MTKVIMTPCMKDSILSWERTGMLGGLNDYHKAHMAVWLENQRLWNVQQYDNLKKDLFKKWRKDLFKRLSIAIIRKAYDSKTFVPYDLVSIQSMGAPVDSMHYRDEYNNLKSKESVCKTRNLKTYIPIVKLLREYDDGDEDRFKSWSRTNATWVVSGEYVGRFNRHTHILQQEAELVTYLADRYAQEVTHEILYDLRGNVKSYHYHWKTSEYLVEYIKITAHKILRERGHPANWMIVSPQMALEIIQSSECVVEDRSYTPNVYKMGYLRNIAIYVDSKSPVDKILLGYKGDYYDSGYFYLPYFISEISSPVVFDDIETYKMCSRYSKRLENSNYYALIVVDNYYFSDKEE